MSVRDGLIVWMVNCARVEKPLTLMPVRKLLTLGLLCKGERARNGKDTLYWERITKLVGSEVNLATMRECLLDDG